MSKRLCTLLVAALLGALTGCDFRFLGGDLDGLLISAERGCAARLDRRHHFELAEADVTGGGATPSRILIALSNTMPTWR